MKQNWFWGTLFFWFVLTGSVVCWALISAQLRFQPQTISHYETKLNGKTQKTELWVNQGRLTELAPIITKKFAKDHWEPCANGLDLTSALLGSLGDSFDLSDQIQIKMFKKNGLYKALGLWQSKDTDETYGIISEVPGSILDLSQSKSNWIFPFPPPPDTIQLFSEKLGDLKIGFIFLPLNDEPVNRFKETCLASGFKQTFLREENNKKIFILVKNKTKILASLGIENNQNVISLIELKN
jgi:hypothetical protein